MEIYPSDLTEAEWALLEPLIPSGKPGGRPREVDMRAVQSADLLSTESWLHLAHVAARLSAALNGVRLLCTLAE